MADDMNKHMKKMKKDNSLKVKAKKTVGKAIKLHEVHMNKPETATDSSQKVLMDLLKKTDQSLKDNGHS